MRNKVVNFLFVLRFLVPVTTAGISHTDHHVMESPQLSRWGEWGQLEHCPSDQVVLGMQLKVHESQGGVKDDTGLNAVKFLCENPFSPPEFSGNLVPITSLVGDAGEWKKEFICPTGAEGNKTVAVGFQLRSETSSGVKDDTAGNNLKLICSDLHQQNAFSVLEGDGTGSGEWTKQQVCWPGYAICGLQTQVEMSKSMDTTGLNNLKVRCCRVDNAAVAPPTNATSSETPSSEDSNGSFVADKDGHKYQHQFHLSDEISVEGTSGEQELTAIAPDGGDDNIAQQIATIEQTDNSETHHEEEEDGASTATESQFQEVVRELESAEGVRPHHDHDHQEDHEHEEEEEDDSFFKSDESDEATTPPSDTSEKEVNPKSSPRFGKIETGNTSTIALSKASSQGITWGVLSMLIFYSASLSL